MQTGMDPVLYRAADTAWCLSCCKEVWGLTDSVSSAYFSFVSSRVFPLSTPQPSSIGSPYLSLWLGKCWRDFPPLVSFLSPRLIPPLPSLSLMFGHHPLAHLPLLPPPLLRLQQHHKGGIVSSNGATVVTSRHWLKWKTKRSEDSTYLISVTQVSPRK